MMNLCTTQHERQQNCIFEASKIYVLLLGDRPPKVCAKPYYSITYIPNLHRDYLCVCHDWVPRPLRQRLANEHSRQGEGCQDDQGPEEPAEEASFSVGGEVGESVDGGGGEEGAELQAPGHCRG